MQKFAYIYNVKTRRARSEEIEFVKTKSGEHKPACVFFNTADADTYIAKMVDAEILKEKSIIEKAKAKIARMIASKSFK